MVSLIYLNIKQEKLPLLSCRNVDESPYLYCMIQTHKHMKTKLQYIATLYKVLGNTLGWYIATQLIRECNTIKDIKVIRDLNPCNTALFNEILSQL